MAPKSWHGRVGTAETQREQPANGGTVKYYPTQVWISAVAISGLLLCGCSAVEKLTTPTLNTEGLAASVEEVVGIPVTVTCPEGIPIQAGLISECSVSDGTIAKVLLVTQVDGEGNVDWEISEQDAPVDQG